MRQGSNGYWYIYWTNRDRESLKTRDKNIARQVFNLRKLETRDAELQALAKKAPTLQGFHDEYIAFRKGEGNAKATVDNDSLALRSLLEYTGDKLISDIDSRDVDKFHAWLMTPRMIKTPKGKDKLFDGCKKASVNCYIRHLKSAFNRAVRWGYIAKSPYGGIKQYPEPEQPFRELTDTEIREKLLPAIKEVDFRLMIQACLQLGARGGEICAAHRDWITEEESGDGGKRKWLVFPDTKRHMSRKVPIGPEMEAILSQLPEKGYLFPRWRRVQTVSHKLKKILRKIGRGDQWLHGLRHNTATKLSRNGHPLRARMKLLGHKQMSTMLRYDHSDDRDLIAAGDSLHFTPILKRAPADKDTKKTQTRKKDM